MKSSAAILINNPNTEPHTDSYPNHLQAYVSCKLLKDVGGAEGVF
jgi:hypothetical protein